jgi:hypothetical protein
VRPRSDYFKSNIVERKQNLSETNIQVIVTRKIVNMVFTYVFHNDPPCLYTVKSKNCKTIRSTGLASLYRHVQFQFHLKTQGDGQKYSNPNYQSQQECCFLFALEISTHYKTETVYSESVI